jgi:hypothetical protein
MAQAVRLGVEQLYTIRELFAADPVKTLEAVAKIDTARSNMAGAAMTRWTMPCFAARRTGWG